MGEHSIYRSLSFQRSIRLLQIHPGHWEDEVICSLKAFDDLSDTPGFEAVSYVWGSSGQPAHVLCDGVAVEITPNLAEALQHLRPDLSLRVTKAQEVTKRGFTEVKPTLTDVGKAGISEGLVWIDALCINQNDAHERGQQVRLMAEIFKQAKRVVIWLGAEDAFVPQAAELLTRLSDLGPFSRRLRHGTVYGYWNKSSSTLAELGFPDQQSAQWKHLRLFFLVPWFTRLWVIQELALAREAGMYIGHYELNIDVLERAVCNFSKFRFFDVLDEDAQNAYWAIDDMFRKDHIWRLRTGKKPNSLWDILPQCIWFHCLDPRDRIFALLSLTSEGASGEIPALIRPDYTKSVEEVYRDATRYCLYATRKLQCLGYATLEAGEHKTCSWAMNLERDLVLNQVCWGNNAAYDSGALSEDTSDAGTLCLHGIPIGVIAAVSPQITDPRAEPMARLDAVKAFLDSAEMFSVRSGIPFQANAHDVARALAAGWLPFLRNLKGVSVLDPTPLVERIAVFLCNKQSPLSSEDAQDLEHLLWWSRTRRFFITTEGRIGLGPPDSAYEDEVVCLLGAPVLHVLRPRGDYHTYVGDCAVPRLMEGQTIKTLLNGKSRDNLSPAMGEHDGLSAEQNQRMRLSAYLNVNGLTKTFVIK